MRVSSIQPSMYKSTQKFQHQINISCKGWRGVAKGAAAGSAGLGTLAVIGLGLCPAAGIIAGLGLLLGAAAGNGVEDDCKSMKKKGEQKNPPSSN